MEYLTAIVRADWARATDRTVNFRATPEDQRIISDLAMATDRNLTYILRRAIRALTVESLMQPLEDGDGDGK